MKLGTLRVSALSAVILGAQLANAQPSYPEFRINTVTQYSQDMADVAPISDVWFVVVWRGYDTQATRGIFGQRVDRKGGPVGGEFRVNTYTTNDQYLPAIAADLAGNFTVVWASIGQDGDSRGIYGQRFSFTGAPIGAEFRVNTATSLSQAEPAVAFPYEFPAGFIVSWVTQAQSGSNILAQRFDANGAPSGEPFRVNTETAGYRGHPGVAASSSGFVVVWHGSDQDGSSTSIHGQRFTPAGSPAGTEFRVSTYTTGYQDRPSVAMRRGDGSFLVSWTDEVGDGDSYGIMGRFYDAAGAPSAAFRVNTDTTSVQHRSAVARDIDGRFLVAWTGQSASGGLAEIRAQRFGTTNLPERGELRVNAYTTAAQYFPAVAGSAGNAFLVVWVDGRGGQTDIYGQHYCLVGDVNIDNLVNVSDILYLINYIYAAGPNLLGCGDANGSGTIDVSDILYLINYIYAGGPEPL